MLHPTSTLRKAWENLMRVRPLIFMELDVFRHATKGGLTGALDSTSSVAFAAKAAIDSAERAAKKVETDPLSPALWGIDGKSADEWICRLVQVLLSKVTTQPALSSCRPSLPSGPAAATLTYSRGGNGVRHQSTPMGVGRGI